MVPQCGTGTRGGTGNMGSAIDNLAPVDWIFLEFPDGEFNSEIAPALAAIVDRGLIRILDLFVLRKDADGSLDVYKISDLYDAKTRELGASAGRLATVLTDDDVAAAAAEVEPGSTAALLVWENTWASAFVSHVRRYGGHLAASGHITAQAVLDALEAAAEDERTT